MPLYKVKEPPYVHAIQWTKENMAEIYDFLKEFSTPPTTMERLGQDQLKIHYHDTGVTMFIPSNFYITLTERGSILTYKPDEFEKMYILVS